MQDPQQPLAPPPGQPHPLPDLGEAPGGASLRSQRLPLADPRQQVERLEALDLAACPHGGDFDAALGAAGWPALEPATLEIF